jgi:hypothetical protein
MKGSSQRWYNASLRAKAHDVFTADDGNGDLEYTIKTSDKYHRLDFGLTPG